MSSQLVPDPFRPLTSEQIAASVAALEARIAELAAISAALTTLERLTWGTDAATASSVTVVDEQPPAPTPAAGVPDKPKPARKSDRASKRTPAAAGGQQGSKYDYVKVARVAREALEAGRPMAAAVAEAFDVNPAMGGWLITRAREFGQDIPKRNTSKSSTPPSPPAPDPQPPAPLVPAKPVGGRVLQCDDCDATFEIGNVGMLATHTIGTHGRRPTLVERTPVAV